MTDKIVTLFPVKQSAPPAEPAPKKRDPISIGQVDQIGFLTKTDRDLWINNPADVLKIMKFIIKEKIQIFEDKD